jgi:poly-beta-1,6-N-acetyl-D-glucosamine synthase
MSRASTNRRSGNDYVLVTAAYNEEAYIENLLRSVTSQTVLPTKWIIVSDGSIDRTDLIVKGYAEKFKFVQLHRITEDHPRNFAAQVHAINVGLALLKDLHYSFIGNLDADVSFESNYFSELLEKFNQDQKLGLSCGWIHEQVGSVFLPRTGNVPISVPHAVQCFRRESLEELGGRYTPFPYGGPDWYAEVFLRMKGWRVQSFSDLKVFHHRPTGAAAGFLKTSYREGLMDYSMGSHPVFELFRVGRRLRGRPFILAALARLFSFSLAYCRRDPKLVSDEFLRFLRKEELERVWSFLRRDRHRSECPRSPSGSQQNSSRDA